MTGLVPMSEPEYRLFVEESISAYAASKVAAGQWPQAESLELSRKTFNQLLPQGLATPGHFIFSITNESAERIGVLWFAVQIAPNASPIFMKSASNRRIKEKVMPRAHSSCSK
jgi:hypothetical protein